MHPLDHIRIVLVEPQHPGNIGGAARACKTMGLSRLVLVTPERFPHTEATVRAAGADDLLANAVIHATLAEAVADCVLVIGTSARERRLAWPAVDARAAARQALACSGPAALVFGRERSGLSNAELDLCHAHLQIPADPGFASLNLAAAVQVVCYELRMSAGVTLPPAATEPAPTVAELEGLYEQLRATAEAGGFLDPAAPRAFMRRIRRLAARARPAASEVQMLRGLFKALDPRRD